MDTHAHDRRRFLALGAALAAAPVLSACGAGFGGDDNKGDGSAADDVTGSFDWKREKDTTVKALLNKHPYTDALIADLNALVGVRPRDIALNGQGLELTGTVYVTEVLGRAVEVTVRLGEQHVSLVAPRADTTGLRPDDPVRLTVRPENLLLFEADRPQRPGRRIGKR